MTVKEAHIKGCFIIEPSIFEDERGGFYESYSKRNLEKHLGQKVDFVQDNQSISKKGVLRGLHYQKGNFAQAKLLRVIKGSVLDVVVDIRPKSETFGQHFKIELSENNNTALFIPRGMAHGFLAQEEETIFVYKCDNYYHKEAEAGFIYNDPSLGIDWKFPSDKLILSAKDSILPTFKEAQL